MPDMDGIDAAGEIYKDAPIPVILVSTYHNRELIEWAAVNHVLAYPILHQEKGNRVHTARILGISRRSLYRLIEKYHLE